MTPKARFTLAQTLLIGGTAALALAALSTRTENASQPLSPQRTLRPAPVTEQVRRPSAPIQDALARDVAGPAPVATPSLNLSALPLPPAAIEEDLTLLQEWILGLPDAELRTLDASGALDRYLAQVVASVSLRNPESSRAELDRFLSRFNARLGVVTP